MQTMPGHHVNEMVTKCVRAVALLITLSTLLVILSTIVPPLLVYLLVLSVPYLVYRSWVAKTRYRVRVGQNRSQRWIEYYTRSVLTDESLPEVRALDLGPLFSKRVAERLAQIGAENRRSFRLELLGSSAFNSLAVFAINVALLSAANRAADGSLTAGDIAVFAAAATGLRVSIDAFVMGIGSLRWHLAHVAALRTFFAISPSPHRLRREAGSVRSAVELDGYDHQLATDMSDVPALALRDVSFTYPLVKDPRTRRSDSDDPAGRDSRTRRPQRKREVDDRQAGERLVRRPPGHHRDRRNGRSGGDVRVPARTCVDRLPGRRQVPRHRP